MASNETTRRLRQSEYLRTYFADTGRDYSTGKNIRCPNQGAHAHGDANASARIYENDGGAFLKCYGCGGSWDIFSLWQLDNGGTFTDAKAALCKRFGLIEPPTPVNRQRLYLTKCHVALIAGSDERGLSYLKDRGISVETCRRFGLGFDAAQQAIIVPQGSGYLSRSIRPDATQKDKCRYFPKGAPREIFNVASLAESAKANTPVFIVEGEIDALSVCEGGGVAVSIGGTSGIGKIALEAAKLGQGIYIPCMDRDDAGEDAQKKLIEKLNGIGPAVHVYEGAPKCLVPDDADGNHLKDTNDALRQDAAAFRSRIADLVGKAQAAAKEEAEKRKPYITLADIPEPSEESSNPRALFKRGYLRKGGGIIAASVAGAGKSTFSLQCALHWVMGVPCFGIEPVRPLKIAVIQAEDDIEELAMFRSNMRTGLATEGFTPERIDEAMRRLHIRTDFVGKTGRDFTDAIRDMQQADKYDLLIVNPLNSYFDGDISINKDATEFFRKLVDPVIKNPVTECGIFFIHHMGKPSKGKESTNWGKGAYSQYAIQGAAEVNNWARAVLIMIPFDKAPDFWTLTAAKRHKPLKWKDADGKDTKDRIIAYSKDCVYWREPDADEIRAAREGSKPIRETKEEQRAREDLERRQAIAAIVSWLQHTSPKKKSEVYGWCDANEDPLFKGFHSHTVKRADGTHFPKRPCYLAYELVTANPLQYGVAYQVGKSKNGRTCELYGGVASLPCRGDPPPASDQTDAPKTIDEIIEARDRFSPPTKTFPGTLTGETTKGEQAK